MELELYLMNFDEQAVKSIHHYEFELSKISTGRANPQLIKGIKIDYYGTMTPLEELANISVPEASQLLVKPFDVSSVKDITKALMAANLGINPVDEGNQVRLTFPALTSDRRKELVKSLAKFTEQAKIGVRNARQDVLKAIKADEELSEDEQKRYQDAVQKQVDIKIELINKITQEKEKELTTL
ncbi:Ribosome recycling factor (Ribosome releasing factor) [Mycoplasmopsis bovigenitalium 51080]|uniref:Ribosome-recycling factor n=1 Tax=Mycoplasmopsis bovigenitalium 51080 TaxID=1188235 RepID=N9VCN3_9BACT|nr:ribosome recycling factor [Mycoplasmopsis bovigenitalium]ENY69453.1 Ribosome recycling factor (Ribosome releasing factor) [Mycoplasmopsis bovigenitalium 51080]